MQVHATQSHRKLPRVAFCIGEMKHGVVGIFKGSSLNL